MTQRHPYEDDLKAYIDGELSLLRRIAVARHLARCASCRMEIAQMSQITEQLRPETHEALDPALRAKILSDLGANSTSPVRAPKRRLAPLVIGSAVAVMAYCVLIPAFMTAHEKARNVSASQASMHVSQSLNRVSANDERMEHVVNANGNAQLQMKDPDSRYQDVNKVQTLSGLPTHGAPQRVEFATKSPAAMNIAGSIDGNDAVRQVHNEASIGVEVANADTASESLETLVKGVGGYIAESSLSTNGDGKRSADISVKVPVDQFASVMTQIGKFGKVTAKSVSGEDITEQASDADQAEQIMEDEVRRTDAQLKARGKRATWRDQEQARDLRIQLAQSRARLQLLKKMARLSDIDVTLSEKGKETPKVSSTFLTNLTASTGDATNSLASAFGRVLALVIWIIAYAPLWVPALLAYRWWARKQAKAETMSTSS
ncbi:MAG: DUF4349 domain-containing protein [Capsulimonas sp.]|uniref:DUF4349 domain-containing protein n=1 Tax=Capsulimonas sp. TaxID=2494211 RepID=UPI003263C7F1